MHNEIGGKRMGEAKLTTMRRLTRWMMSWRMITITAIRSIRRFYKSNKPKEEVFSLQQVILNSGKSRSKKEWRKQPLWRCSTSPLTLLESKSHQRFYLSRLLTILKTIFSLKLIGRILQLLPFRVLILFQVRQRYYHLTRCQRFTTTMSKRGCQKLATG